MPKNTKGGKNAKKGKNKPIMEGKRKLEFKEEGQEYAKVLKMHGGDPAHAEVKCLENGLTKMGRIRGSMKKKKVWIAEGDIVLFSLRDFENGKGDIIWKYSIEEVRQLKKMGELPSDLEERDTGAPEGEEDQDVFEYDLEDL